MRDILKRVFIGVAIGMALFFLKTQVFAATTLASTPRYRVLYYSGTAYGTSVCSAPATATVNQTSFIDFGTGYSHSSSSGCTLLKEVHVNLVTTNTSSQYFLPNVTYTFQFTWNFNPRTYYNLPEPITQIYNGSSYVNSSVVSIVSYSSSRKSDNYGYLINIQFTVSSSQRYVQFVFEPTVASNNSLIPRFYQQGINLRDSTFTQTDDPTTIALQEQNNILNQGFNNISNFLVNIISSNDSIYGPNDNATWFPSDSYPVDYWLEEAEPLDQSMDVDVSSFLFDTNTWAGPFSYIWSLVTSFVTVNLKVFSMITAFLTLSFVGLVLGRS